MAEDTNLWHKNPEIQPKPVDSEYFPKNSEVIHRFHEQAPQLRSDCQDKAMNTENILNPRIPAVQPPITRAAELYPLVLTPRILNLRGIGARHIRAMVAAGTLQRIQRGAYIYTRDAQALTPDERLAVRCIAAHLMGLQGVFSHTSAAALWGLDVLNTPSIVHVYSTATSPSDRGAHLQAQARF